MNSKDLQKYNEQVSKEYKERKAKSDFKKKQAYEANQRVLLEPKNKNNLIIWSDKNNNGSVYEGNFGKEKCFEIKRGFVSFSLKIIHKEIVSDKKNSSSIELIKLQEKANKILWNNPEFLRKFKPVS
jgi:hypothetical protein